MKKVIFVLLLSLFGVSSVIAQPMCDIVVQGICGPVRVQFYAHTTGCTQYRSAVFTVSPNTSYNIDMSVAANWSAMTVPPGVHGVNWDVNAAVVRNPCNPTITTPGGINCPSFFDGLGLWSSASPLLGATCPFGAFTSPECFEFSSACTLCVAGDVVNASITYPGGVPTITIYP